MNLRFTLTATTAALALTAGATGVQANDYYVSVFGGWSNNGNEPHFAGFTNTASTKTVNTVAYTQVANNVPYGTKGTYADVYLGLHVGTNIYGTSKFDWSEDFEDGFVVGGALGRDFGSFRTELELAYRTYDVDGGARIRNNFDGRSYIYGYGTLYYVVKLGGGTTVGGKTTAFSGKTPSSQPFPFTVNLPYNATVTTLGSTSGSLDAWSLMANIWVDFDPFNIMPDTVTPFIGGGIGAAMIDFEYSVQATSLFGGTLSSNTAGDDIVLAYQLGAGLDFEVGNGITLSAQYRYFGSMDADIGGGADVRMDSHNIMFGLSFPFGSAPAPVQEPVRVAPAPPPPPPAPEPEPEVYVPRQDRN